jgi:hypothetical protein
MAAQVHYGFPILQPEVIIETLAQYSINVRPGQLKTPTAEFMMSTCTQVVQKITGITEAALSGLADEVLEAQDFAYPVSIGRGCSRQSTGLSSRGMSIGPVQRDGQQVGYVYADVSALVFSFDWPSRKHIRTMF